MENKTVKVLLIEDNIDDAELIRRKLENHGDTRFQVTVAQKLNDGLEMAEKAAPDLILSDLGLPDSHGLDTVTKILLAVPQIPLVVLSGFDDRDIAIKAVQSGAQDYLVKGHIDDSQLERSLYYSIERAGLQSEVDQNVQEISKLHANLLKILENSADGIIVVGEGGQIQFTNPAVESLFGRKPKELLRQPFEYPLVAGNISEIEIPRADGQKNIAEMSVVSISWEGKPAHLVTMYDITDRKAMEEALRASEEKYRDIVELATQGIITTNLKGEIISCNQSFLRMTGFAETDIVGKHFKEVPNINLSDLPLYTKMFMSLLNGAKNPPLEIPWVTQDRTMRVFELTSNLMKSNGVIIGVQTVVTDITERKAMEEAMRLSEEKYRNIVEMAPEGIVTLNLQGEVTSCNQSLQEMLGVTAEEVLGKHFTKFPYMKVTDFSVFMETFKALSSGKKAPPIEMSGITKNGISKICELRSSIMKTKDNIVGIQIIVIDITERKHMENAIRESEEKFSKAFHSSVNLFAIARLDDGKFIEINEAFTEMTGYTREEVIGHNATELNLWADEEEHRRIVKKVRENDIIRNEQIGVRTKSGEIRTGLFSSEKINIGGVPCFLNTITDITELKKAEESLKISEEKFSKAFHNSPEVIIISSIEDGTIYEANNTFLCLSGYNREEVISKTTRELGIWAFPEERAEAVKILKKTGLVSNREYHFRMKSGEIRTWLFSAEIINIDNKPCMVSVTTDITERKKMEEALRFSDTVLKSIHEGIFALDNEYKITHWNEICEQIFGIKASDAIGKEAKDVIIMVEEYPGQNKKRINLLIEKGYNKEEQIYRTPRGDVWVDVHAQAIEQNGKRHGFVTLISDISWRKSTEEALKQSEEKYRQIINTSNDGIISIDTQMKIIVWNHGAEKIFGYTEKEILGQSVMTIFPATVHKDVARELIQIEQTGTSTVANRVFETYVLKKDCSPVPVDISISTRKTGDNYTVTAIMRDISVRKEAEEKLRKIDQMKSEFLSNVSHELRTPLQSISGFTKLIMNGQVPDQATQQEFLQIIDRETTHLGNLINGLLDMSRLEAGRFQVYKKLISVYDIFTDSIEMFHSLAREKNITLEEHIPARLPKMEVDSERMRQVVINLIGNAIKFSEPGTNVNVRVGLRDSELLFQVSDHGPGIREEAMKHLFERFYRVDGETVKGGTGLGLYISKQIIEAHGGRIWTESKFGEGSTFSFSLPLKNKGGNNHGKENTNN